MSPRIASVHPIESKRAALSRSSGRLGGTAAKPSVAFARRGRAPAWEADATRALGQASAAIRMLAVSTPRNLRAELDRLGALWARGEAAMPCFVYGGAPDHRELERALCSAADRLEREGDLGGLYAGRARELADEAAICRGVGGSELWVAARRRFARRDSFDDAADALVARWLEDGAGAPSRGEEAAECDDGAAPTRSDDEGSPSSLVSRMRQEIGARRLPVRVVVARELASLAATGDGAVQVVAGRWLPPRDVERTVLHEVLGHVLPRVGATAAHLGIFAVGSARGADDQEGRARALERRAGFLDGRRRRELALRHVAARTVERRADFVETTRELCERGGAPDEALRIAARAHRGGGLARESVYVPALLRFEAAAGAPDVERVLGAGRVAVELAGALAAWV